MVGNTHPPGGSIRVIEGDGKCRREQTADGASGRTGKGERVR